MNALMKPIGMKVVKFVILFFLISPLYSYSQDGNKPFGFLDIPVSSHANALGGNNISIIEEDVAMAFQNPALLGQEMDLQFNLNYMNYVADINIAGAAFAKAVGNRGAFAVGIQYADFGKIIQTEANGNIIGSFTPKDIAFNGMYSHDFTDRLRGGINAKFIYSVYEQYNSLALGVDLGLNYYNLEKELSVSLLIKNLGGQLKKFDNKQEGMPWDIQLGLSKTLSHAPFRFSVMAHHLNKWNLSYPALKENNGNTESTIEYKDNFFSNLFRHLIFGVDFLPTKSVYVSLGYNYKTRTDMKTYGRNFISGFSAGAGIQVKMFGVGVSVSQHAVGNTSFMFNLTCNTKDFLR